MYSARPRSVGACWPSAPDRDQAQPARRQLRSGPDDAAPVAQRRRRRLGGLTGEAPAGIGVLDSGPIASGNQVDAGIGSISPSVPVTVCGNGVGLLGDASSSCGTGTTPGTDTSIGATIDLGTGPDPGAGIGVDVGTGSDTTTGGIITPGSSTRTSGVPGTQG